jgi:hypothetical protein
MLIMFEKSHVNSIKGGEKPTGFQGGHARLKGGKGELKSAKL